MIAPWRFKCENLHLQFEVRPCKGAHMSIVLNRLSVLPKYAKISNRYVLTVSKFSQLATVRMILSIATKLFLKLSLSLMELITFFQYSPWLMLRIRL